MVQLCQGGSGRLDTTLWRESRLRDARPDLRRSLFDVATSVVAIPHPDGGDVRGVDLLLLVVVLAVPAAGFLMRTFIVFHDGAHGSFLPENVRTTGWASPAGLLSIRPTTSGASTSTRNASRVSR